MQSFWNSSRFWCRWLVVSAVGIMFFGVSMVVAPAFILEGFSMLVYSSSGHIATFGSGAVAYVSLVHAILGSVMFGWGFALLFSVLGPFRRGSREGWQAVAVSVTAWCIPDTAFSLWSGFWQNALLNVILAIVFAVPLAATYRGFHEVRT